MKYEKSYWDYGWAYLGIAVCLYGVFVGTAEFIWLGVPVILLAYKCILQNKHIQDLEDEVTWLYSETQNEEIYEYPYVVSDAVDSKWSIKRSN